MANGFRLNNQEQMWYKNPPLSLSPDWVRPYTFCQFPSRDGLYEDQADLPQQTAGTGNISMDLSSKVSTGGYQDNSKNTYDVQLVNTPFTFNNQNINNYTAIPPAVQDAIYNNTTQQNNNYYTTGASGGVSGSVTSLSNPTPMWDNTDMKLTFISKTTTFVNGLITNIVNNANVVVTLTKLKTLSDWYDTATTDTSLLFVQDVLISGTNFNEEKKTLTLDHGLIKTIPSTTTPTTITTITTCA